MTTRRLIGLGLLALGAAALYRWLNPPYRPAVFHSYSDNFAGMWGLTLYRDGGFAETLPGSWSQQPGRFQLSGDTVLLHYADSARLPVAAYCIDRPAKKIYKLRRGKGRWLADDPGRDWSQIQLDKLPR